MANHKSMSYYDTYFDRGFDIRRRRIFFTNDLVTEDDAERWMQAFLMLEAEAPEKPIEIILSTFGGSVFEALGLYDIIRASKCHVTTIGVGKIMSAGVLLISAGDERKAYPNTQFMIHEMSYELPYEKHAIIKSDVQYSEQVNNTFLQCIADRTNWSFKELKRLTHSRPDKYFTAEDALKYGLIDKIIEID